MKKATLYLFWLLLLSAFSLSAQQKTGAVHPSIVKYPLAFEVTGPLRDNPVVTTDGLKNEEFIFNNHDDRHINPEIHPPDFNAMPPDPQVQDYYGTQTAGKAIIHDYAGQNSPSYPPDTNGSVNANYYFQVVNTTYAIYDKNTGSVVAGPSNLNTIFNSSLPGANCNDGDPIVLWDEHANKWFYAEFALCTSNNYMLIAVSQTADPTGAWWSWSFDVDDVPDYMKFGIWQDGYYMATNTDPGNDVYVFERSKMITGDPNPAMIGFDNPDRPNTFDGFHCILPFDNDGAWAPAGSPGQFITIADDGQSNPADALYIYELQADWTTPANSTFARTQTLNVNPFSGNFDSSWDNIPQPGTSQELDGLSTILMYRAQYRNFSGDQRLVIAHTIAENANEAAIRWYELVRSGGSWSIRQQSTYNPDNISRWNMSIAMNGDKEIAMGFSVSDGSSTYPGIRYVGQSAAANNTASNTLDIAETVILSGSHSQTLYNRWGDYCNISVDPADDHTFWFTSEYMDASTHGTRIVSFELSSPSSCPDPTNLTASNITDTQADLSWTAGGSETAWNIEYGTTGFSQGTGTTISGVTNPYTLTGLSPNTAYDYYVQADCGGGSTSAWVGPYTFVTHCASAALPYSNNFDSNVDCWTAEDTNADNITWSWGAISASCSADSNDYVLFVSYNSSAAMDDWLFSPPFDLTAGVNYTLDFSYGNHGGTTYTEDMDVFLSTGNNSTDGAAGTLLFSQTGISGGCHSFTDGSITVGTTGTYYIAFHGKSPADQWTLMIDDFAFYETPPCPDPSNLSASNITQTQADLSWTENGSATVWNIELGPAGFSPTGTPTHSGVSNPFTATGLNPGTYYDYYVQADCGGGSTSAWVGPYTFITLCSVINTFPYTEDFALSNWPACWTQTSDLSSQNWIVSGSNHSGGTANEMGETYQSGTGITRLISPEFDLSGLTTPHLEFKYFFNDYGPGITGKIQTSTDGGTTWTDEAWSITSGGGDLGPDTVSLDLSNYGPSTLIAWVMDGDHYQFDWWTIDDVFVGEAPSCAAPTGLSASNITTTQADLSWTENGSATVWNIELGPAGFSPTGTPTDTGVTNPYTVTGLSPGTHYDYYVQADCSHGNTSSWSGPYTFMTQCTSVALPYSNDFDTDFDCWTIEDTNGDGTEWQRGTSGSPLSCIADSNDYVIYVLYNPSAAMDDWLFSPAFDLTAGVNYTLEFSYGNDGGTTYTEDMDVFLSTGNNSTDAAAGTLLFSQTGISGGCHSFTDGSITVAATGTYYIAFHGVSPADQDVLMIDDFAFYETPSCPAPTNLSASNITDTQADLSWTPGGSETLWNIELGPAGFSPTGTPTNTGVTNPFTVTGLTPSTAYDYYVQADCSHGNTSTWAGPFTFVTQCASVALPYSNNFDNNIDCWTAEDTNSDNIAWSWGALGYSCSADSNDYVLFVSYNSSAAMDDWLFSPPFDLTAGINYTLEFSYGNDGGSAYTEDMDVFLSTGNNSTDGATGTLLFSQTGISGGCHSFIDGSITVAATGTYYIAFHGKSPADQDVLMIDDFAFYETPSCPAPTNLSASNITDTQADLSWTPGGSETVWNIEYGLTGFAQGTGTNVSGVTSNPYTLTGLTSNTSYDYYVQADCGSGTTSSWAGPYTFSTFPGCGDTFYDDGGPTGDYSPNLNQTMTIYPNNPGDVVTVTFNSFDMEQGWDGMMVYDGTDTTSPIFDSGSTYNRPACPNGAWTGAPGDTYTADGHSFTATNAAGALTLVFTSDSSIQHAGWEAVITCAAPPTCPDPSNLSASNITDSQADLSWTAGGSETVWNIEYGLTGFTQGTGTTVSGVTSNPYTLTGLSPNTSYDYYVQADCGGGSTSAWAGPYTFTTLCSIINTFPYTEDFENAGNIPDCWVNDPADAGGEWEFTTANSHGPSSDHTSGTGYYALLDDYFTQTSESPFNLISPVFDLSTAGTSYQLIYWYWIGPDGATNPIHVDISTDGGSTWTNDVYTHDHSVVNTWAMNIIDLSAYNTASVVIRFRGESIYDYGTDNSGIDDFMIREYPCNGITTTWDGTSWDNGTPGPSDNAIINGDYIGEPPLNVCSLVINSGFAVWIDTGETYTVNTTFINNGEIYVADGGSFVQTDDYAVVDGTGIFTTERITTPYHEYDYTYFSSPSATADLSATFVPVSNPNIANYLWTLETANFNDDSPADTYDDEGDDWAHASGTMTPGVGYAVLGQAADFPFDPNNVSNNNTDDIEFDGAFNTGDITVPVVIDNSGTDTSQNQNLIGNPYPSAIDLEVFQPDNSSVLSTNFYFWTHNTALAQGTDPNYAWGFTNDDYSQYVVGTGGVGSASGAPAPTQYVSSCQGFICEANGAGTVTFKNSHRVAGNNSDFHTVANGDKDRIWLNLTDDNGMFRQILLAFLPEASDAYDAYDGVRKWLGEDTDFYSVIEGTDKHISIQGMSAFNPERIVPLGIQIAEAGEYHIAINNVEGIFTQGQNIYLYDHYTNISHNLSDGAYTFTSVAGLDINDRFEVRFTENSQGIHDAELSYLGVYPNPSGGLFKISWMGEHTAMMKITDLTGKVIMTREVDSPDNTYSLDLSNYAAGVYFIQMEVNGRHLQRKLMLK